MPMNKLHNEYAAQLSWYEDCPKAVFAAIAVSSATLGGSYLDEAEKRVAREWNALHEAGIVPQKPPARIAVQGIESPE